MESDKVAMQGAQALATAISGIATGIGGLGIGGGLLLAGLIWGRDLQELAREIIGFWPEAGSIFSPEWIANFGDNPIDIFNENAAATNNQGVNELPPIANPGNLSGRSYYDVYSIAASGRAAAWTHNKNLNASITWQEYIELNGWKTYNYPTGEGPNSKWQQKHNAMWAKLNPQPPPVLTMDEVSHQTSLRLTCARRNLVKTNLFGQFTFYNIWLPYGEDNPRKVDTYQSDKLLDWCAWVDPKNDGILEEASPNPYNYKSRKNDALVIITEYSYWSATP